MTRTRTALLERSVRCTKSAQHRTPLSPELLTTLRARLETQRAFRIEQLAALGRPHRDDLLGSGNHEVHACLYAGARCALQDVQTALWRMEEGRYGRCVDCGAALPARQLEAMPQAARCLDCPAHPDAEQGGGR